jgi:hypothetical protein
MTIRTLKKDIEATNALKAYRKRVGSTQKPRNHYSWWQALFVMLTYGPNTCFGACFELEEKTGIKFSLFFANLIRMAADGKSPCPVRREYTKSLPVVAENLGLQYERVNPGVGRPSFVFSFANRRIARKHLLKLFPHMSGLFGLLDRN